ncbi:hypothetical protein GGH94_004963 [Coemansia aciculifera]|uniref:Calcium/proton exchanger n=1 Tax=Coemansia aciculifera TaxID=417176 RepID=A0A9W8IEC6_9FUNG|nr:hypothetical protein GGH94_004963 [Coemansia aciculifera]
MPQRTSLSPVSSRGSSELLPPREAADEEGRQSRPRRHHHHHRQHRHHGHSGQPPLPSHHRRPSADDARLVESGNRRGESNSRRQAYQSSDFVSDGSNSESGSTSCSTASKYSIEYPDSRGRSHRHRHHRRSFIPAEPHRRQSISRRMSVQNIAISRRSTGHRRSDAAALLEHSGDEEAGDIEGSPEADGGRSWRRSATNESSESTEDIPPADGDEPNVRARQEALNTRHPFGLPIWKPALYKKSRSVTRAAFLALHARPLRSAKLFLKPGNIAWMLLVGWWLLLVCLVIAAVLYVIPFGGQHYARVAGGLGWYLLWPFGRYVERIKGNAHSLDRCALSVADLTDAAQALEAGVGVHAVEEDEEEDAPLLGRQTSSATLDAAAAGPHAVARHAQFRRKTALGRAVYYALLVVVLNPILIAVSALSWFAVFSIPMGKLTHTLARYLWRDPLSLHFRSGDLPTVKVPQALDTDGAEPTVPGAVAAAAAAADVNSPDSENAVEQPAPTVLLCTNEAMGWYYYKYTVDGVNILFYNMLSVAAFVLVAAFVIAPLTNHRHVLVQPGVLFPLCLVSTIPLAYFIGQAVSSISAQSSLGMGAVINATFGSIVEVILYSIALTQGKARLVEGALIGSLLAGLMLMPGTSMIAGGIKHKVQRFNAKSAEVTATLVIMSIIGAFAPTLFYHTFAVPEFECQDEAVTGHRGTIHKCRQTNVNFLDDPFYHETVKPFMFFCTAILPLAYLIALWFSLKTHVKHIYSSSSTTNPIIRHVLELFRRQRAHQTTADPELGQGEFMGQQQTAAGSEEPRVREAHLVNVADEGEAVPALASIPVPVSATAHRAPPRISRMATGHGAANTPSSLPNVPRLSQLPRVLAADPDDQLPDLALLEGVADGVAEGGGHGGGHDAPNWSKAKSAFILCACTVVFSLIAEVLVDTVDVVIQGLGIKEKYIGLTLFALVPNVTEFMNAIAFAIQNNIALSIEISNAYTVQVALLQIPILVFFSAFYGVPDFVNIPPVVGALRSALTSWLAGEPAGGHLPTDPSAYVFALLFPQWDLIAILFCVFLLTYMLIEGKANYFKGSILCLSYCVWMVSYAFEPIRGHGSD